MTSHRQQLYDYLLSHSACDDNAQTVACMLATQYSGSGAMPSQLGLGTEEFALMLAAYFPGISLPASIPFPREPVDPRLLEEKDELHKLLLLHSTEQTDSENWMSEIVATGCMAGNHLWEDLGLWSRADLTALMERNFPQLAAKNEHNMRWKKFLYKQLCLQEGIYLCRAPSCEVCVDYALCFSPE
ncbi:MAG: nitrogen fixation protein NifQ [Candidatus Competibacteraceae bacterium]|jgi:nitrogen fixation protein NifQ|nr:nitrogen fixation protein NifQ [Candidatus Competibacteraceae bacterium]